MALVNIAEILYARGLKVLIVDFDLEAPGLERFFDTPQAILEQRGIIDMLVSYRELRLLSRLEPHSDNVSSNFGPFPFPIEPLDNFVTPVYQQSNNESNANGELFIIPAGRRAGNEFAYYAERLSSFDWEDFLLNLEGEKLFDWFREETQKTADVVLIDSRTGITDMGGMCTHHLADTVMMFTVASYQSLDGIKKMATSLTKPELIEKGRKGRELKLLFVPSRIELNESVLLDEFKQQFNDVFTDLYPPELQFQKNPFDDLKIGYVPYYAFKEKVAVRDVRESGFASAVDLVESYEKLVTAMFA